MDRITAPLPWRAGRPLVNPIAVFGNSLIGKGVGDSVRDQRIGNDIGTDIRAASDCS